MTPGPFVRFPEVARVLAATEPAPATPLDAGARTLRIEGRQLTSAYDRTAEAALQAGRIDSAAREATVYGVALGDLPRALLARPQLVRLRVVMLDVAAVAASLAHGFDHAWAHDPRVEVLLGAHEQAPTPPYAVAPAALALADASAAQLRDALMLELVAPYQARKFAEREAMVEAGIRANEELLARDPDVSALFGTRPGARALIAGAGPTLSEAGDFIRAARAEGALLIAVTTALRPLAAQGIRPDFAVVIDPLPALLAHFDGLPSDFVARTPLVYAPCVHPAVVRAWKGPRYPACLAQPRYQARIRREQRGSLFCAGTVTHTAVDFAVQLGAAEVVLLGTDFAYVDRRSHAHGAAHERGAPKAADTWVLDGHGERVPSDLALIGFLRDLEDYIARHPGVRFHTLSRRGAHIRGTTWI